MAEDNIDQVMSKLKGLGLDNLTSFDDKKARIEMAVRAGIISRDGGNAALRIVEKEYKPQSFDNLVRSNGIMMAPKKGGSLTGGFSNKVKQDYRKQQQQGASKSVQGGLDALGGVIDFFGNLGGGGNSGGQGSPGSSYSGSNPYLDNNFDSSSRPNTSYSPVGYNPQSFNAVSYTPGSYTPATIEMPDLPDVPEFDFQRRDFSDDANRMTQDAYGPAFAALDKAVNNAKNQYTVADRITKGMYENLVNDIAQGAQQDQARYNEAIQNTGQRGQDARQTVASAYDNAAAQEAALMRRFGLSGGATIRGDTSQKAYQQSELAQSQQAQQQGLQRSQAAQGDYNSSIENAENTAGTVARENNLRDLGGVLAGIDSQRANIGTEQALKALELGQQLSSQDLNVQQMQYGAAQDQLANLMNQAQMRLGVEQANVGALNQAGQFNVGNQNQALAFNAGAQNQAGQFNVGAQNQALAYGADQANRANEIALQNSLAAWQTEQQAKAEAQSRKANQWNADRQYNADQTWNQLDRETQLAKIEAERQGQGQGGLDFDDQGIVAQAIQRVAPLVGGDVNQATQLMQLTQDVMASPVNREILSAAGENGRQAFISMVAEAAQSNGYPLPAAIQMAADMWQLASGGGNNK